MSGSNPRFTPSPQPPQWKYAFDPVTGEPVASFNGVPYSGGSAGVVTSFETRTGAVTLEASDVETALGYNPSSEFAPATGSTEYAPASGSTEYAPATGSTVYAPIAGSATQAFSMSTPATGDNSTLGATTAFVDAAIAAGGGVSTADIIGDGAAAYTDVTSSRALGTTYTNSNSRPLYACGYFYIPGSSSGTAVVNIAGVIAIETYAPTGGTEIPFQFIVPIGATYELGCNVAVTLEAWSEY
jgi:hypothetical protein